MLIVLFGSFVSFCVFFYHSLINSPISFASAFHLCYHKNFAVICRFHLLSVCLYCLNCEQRWCAVCCMASDRRIQFGFVVVVVVVVACFVFFYRIHILSPYDSLNIRLWISIFSFIKTMWPKRAREWRQARRKRQTQFTEIDNRFSIDLYDKNPTSYCFFFSVCWFVWKMKTEKRKMRFINWVDWMNYEWNMRIESNEWCREWETARERERGEREEKKQHRWPKSF